MLRDENVEILKELVKVKIKEGEDFCYKKFEAKDIKIIKDIKNNIVDAEEEANYKELQELEKLEKLDQKNKNQDEEI